MMIRSRMDLNLDWKFYYGEIKTPYKTVKKAAALGGYTSVMEGEKGERVPLAGGGRFFLNLISGGNLERGLQMLAGTEFDQNMEEWKSLDLPHDWKIDLDYVNQPELLMSGSKPDGIGWYRKVFSMEEAADGKKIQLVFEGVLRSASVWLNGCFLGEHYSGYSGFSFDVSDLLHYGEEGDNVLLIKVDTTTGPEGWWYEGAGIYRPVYLEITEKLYIPQDGLHIAPTEISEDKTKLQVNLETRNETEQDLLPKAFLSILDQEGKILMVAEQDFSIRVGETKGLSWELELKEPRLWSVEEPYLYQAKVELLATHRMDQMQTKFGIRSLAYGAEGLLLNGKLTEIKGVCEHQDFAGVGIALNRDIVRYKLLRLKEMGANAYRSAHHPASLDLLELCDELGFLVMDENRILESSEHRLMELETMVKRDRNHPCVVFYSLCNEEVIGSTAMGRRMAKGLARHLRRFDQDRFIVSAELLSPEGYVDPEYIRVFDILGVNYPESPIMGAGLERIHENYPEQKIMSSESASFFSTRGIYQDNWDLCHTSNYGSCLSSFQKEPLEEGAPGAGGTAHPEQVMDFYRSHPYMGGCFIWTALDYHGEPAPFAWPAIGSQFGIMDNCGFPKDYYYYYQSLWTKEAMLHVLPHWTHPGKEGQEIEVRVFTNCDEVELFANEKSLGRKKLEGHYLSWKLIYEPGILVAKGYKKGALIVGKEIKTAGKMEAVRVKELLKGDTSLYEVTAVDAFGTPVPDADTLLHVEVEGGAKLIGCGNGNPMDHTLHQSKDRRLFSGKLLVLTRKVSEEEIRVLLS